LKWCNFLSTGNNFTEINLCKSPSTLIVGENGAGKSTILDALCFVLYNKPFRKVNKSQLINSINGKALVVEIEFDIGTNQYRIVRGMKPQIFEIYLNGTLINQHADAKEYQDMLERHILKINFKSFSQIVILGSASFTPFMQLTTPHRREVIEDLLDIEVFSTMNTLLKTKIQENREHIQKSDMSIQLIDQKIESFKSNVKELKNNNQNLIEDLENNISDQELSLKEIITKYQKYEKEIQSLTDTITDMSKVQKKIKSLDEVRIKLTEKKRQIEENINFFNNNDKCPVCTQEIGENFKHQKTSSKQDHLQEIDQGFLKLKEERQAADSRLREIEKVQSQISSITQLYNNLRQQENIVKNTIQSHKKSIHAIQNQTKKIDLDQSILHNLENEYKIGIEEKNTLVKYRQVLE
ncbi:hypothetical protein EBS02_11055, partial [bacterium]|nr:hypothetical protein [bacterium]